MRSAGTQAGRGLGVAALALAAGMVASASLGPLVAGVLEYHVSDDVENQIVGSDAAMLLVVAPAVAAAGLLLLARRQLLGSVLALGPAAFAAYTFAQLIVGQEQFRYPGNAELFFPLQLALFVLGGGVLLGAWRAVQAASLPAPSRRVRRTTVGLLVAGAAFLVLGLHVPGYVDAVADQPARNEYLAGPTAFWMVKLMDLGIVVPAAVVAALGLLRETDWALKVAYAVVGWFAFLGAAVAAMAITMYARDDPDASLGLVIGFGSLALAFAALAVLLYRPLARGPADGPVARAPTPSS